MSLPRFGVTNPVPMNLLMGGLLLSGLVAFLTLKREFFPDVTPQMASVTMPYPGAKPEDIERTLAKKVEDKLADLDEVDELRTNLAEGGGGITVEFRTDADIDKAVDEVERAIDSLTDLPEEAEEIRVSVFEPRMQVIMVSLYGDIDEELLKRGIRQIRDDLRTLPGMGEIQINGVRDYEVRVDVRKDALQEHGLSLQQVSEAIRREMLDLPGGSVKTGQSDISVRTLGVPEEVDAIRQIIVKTQGDQLLRLEEIADISDNYVDQDLLTRHNGAPSVSLVIYRVGDQDAVGIAKMVRSYVRGRQYAAGNEDADFEPGWLDRLYMAAGASQEDEDLKPKTPQLKAWELGANSAVPLPTAVTSHSDLARFIEGRLDLLFRNALLGLGLVFVTLLIFLNWRAALWVGIGLATALGGTVVIMSALGISLNLLTMFGLIIVVGLLVDDAIVVAENVQARYDRGEPALVAAINGTEQVFWPVVATVLTTIVAFLPLTFIRGQIGDLLGALPTVVACALAMSLVESVLILPGHLGHSFVSRDRKKKQWRISRVVRRYEEGRDNVIQNKIIPAYARVLKLVLRRRYISLSIALSMLMISVGMIAGGRAEFTFLPDSDSETLIVDVRMPIGTSMAQTEAVISAIELASLSQNETRSVSSYIGTAFNMDTGQSEGNGGHLAQMFIELKPVEERTRTSQEVTDSIRKAIGPMEHTEQIKFTEIQGGPGGADITIQISGAPEVVEAAARDIKKRLGEFDGVFDIADDNYVGQREVKIMLKPGAEEQGFNRSYVASQVRGSLFGYEPHVFTAFEEDIDVRVRLDEKSRRNLSEIENMWIVSPSGQSVPLSEIAEVEEGAGYASIRRVDRRRVVTITADTSAEANPEMIVPEMKPDFERLEQEYPGLTIDLAGRQRQFNKAFETLPIGFGVAVILIYLILAWLFGSYIQPITVMMAIPFALIGVIWGHLLLGYQLTFLSLIGFVALSGIVVNDSLILVKFFNDKRKDGLPLVEALIEAGRRRLRPIFLTTITTVLGLTPLMLEQSFQAKFLIPMAIAISFGLMSATVLILLLLPCLMVIFDDIRGVLYFCWNGERRPPESERMRSVMDSLPD